MNLADSMQRAKVLDYNLQQQLIPLMKDMKPRPSIYFPDFIAANQKERADNVLCGSKQELLEKIRHDICHFRSSSGVEKVSGTFHVCHYMLLYVCMIVAFIYQAIKCFIGIVNNV